MKALRTLPLFAALLVTASVKAPDDLDQYVVAQMEQRHIVGLSLAVVDGGRIVTARAYGLTDRGEARRVDTTTLFQAGSISKSVAAMGALSLVEHHKLDLDRDINTELRSWHLPPSSFTTSTPVTLRRILSHTAGITVHGFPGYDVDSARPTLVQVLDGMAPANTEPIRNDLQPGTKWRYSGGGYTIMQQAMIDVTGESFPSYMRHTVLEPLGMLRSTYEQPLPARFASMTAAGYYNDGRAVHGRSHVYPEMAAAGLWTTPSDLARFAIGLQQANAGKPSVISQSMAKEMLTDQMNSDGLGVMLGHSGSELLFTHGGRDEGFDAQLMATATTGQAYAIMINANDNSRFMQQLGAFIAQKYQWPGVSPYHAPPAVAISPAALAQVPGFYDTNGDFLTLASRKNRLFVLSDGLPDEEFVPVAQDTFVSTSRNARFVLMRNASGATNAVTWMAGTSSRVLPRLGPLFSATPRGESLTQLAGTRALDALHALSVGGSTLSAFAGFTPGAHADLKTAWLPISGLSRISLVGAVAVEGNVVRHGGQVARIGYYRTTTAYGERLVLVYFTKDDFVTDVDVVAE